MNKKYIGIALILFLFFSSFGLSSMIPPIPARIGGTLTIGSTQITHEDDAGYVIIVTSVDGTPFTPSAEDTDGLDPSYHMYLIDIPLYDADDQPGGAVSGDTVIIHVYKENAELEIISPANGQITVGQTGSRSRIDLTAREINRPPVANAGTDQTVNSGDRVKLNGSNSSDPDPGDEINYLWEQISGTTVILSDTASPTPTFTAPDADSGGISLTFELTVTDTKELQHTDQVIVNVKPAYAAPVADAGDDQTVNEGDEVILDGSGSHDPDNDIASYLWRQTDGASVTLSNSASVQAAFIAPDADILVFELEVTDAQGLKSTDQVIISITSHQNLPPIADAGQDQTVNQGDSVMLDASKSSDPDDGIAFYAWQQTGGTSVTLLNPESVHPTFTAPSVGVNSVSLTFKLTVTDKSGLTATDTVTITINPITPQQPPVADAGADQIVEEGDTVILNGSASYDPDGTIVSYNWVQISGTSITLSDAASVNPTFVAKNGNLTGEALVFELTVTDNTGLTHSDRVTINITAGNEPPVADAGADQTVKNGNKVTLDGSASYDPDGDIVSYQWRQTTGTIVNFSSDTIVNPNFIATGNTKGETLVFELTVTDNGGLQHTDDVSVTVMPEKSPPSADAGNDQRVNEGDTVTLDGSGSEDSDGEIVSYQWQQISGTPISLSHPDQAQTTFTAPHADEVLVFELTVTDNDGLTDTDRTMVEIISVNEPPVADAGADRTVSSGTKVILDGSASHDLDNGSGNGIASYKWRQIQGTPVTLSDAAAARSEFTAETTKPEGESLVFELEVTDDQGLKGTDQVTIRVILENQFPIANAGNDQLVNTGDTVVLDGTRSNDPDGSIIAYAWIQTIGHPVTLSNDTSVTSEFIAQNGSLEGEVLVFELTVTDNKGAQDTDKVMINIRGEKYPPKADAGPDQSVRQGDTVTLDGSNSADPDGTITAYQWRQIQGTIMELSDPKAAKTTFIAENTNEQGESLVFELTVTDNENFQHTDRMTVNVSVGNIVPVADAGSDQSVSVGDTVRLDGSNSKDPDGRIVSYLWIQVAGTVMTLSDAAAVKPSFAAQNINASGESLVFDLVVADNGGLQHTDRVTINVVSSGNQPPIANAGANQTAAPGCTVVLNGSNSRDPENRIASYLWRQTSGTSVTLSDAAAVMPIFTAPSVSGGSPLIFELTVTDIGGLKSTDSVTVNITVTNHPPVADAGTDQMVMPGDRVILDGSGSDDPDPGDDIIVYQWHQISGTSVQLSDTAAVAPAFTAPDGDNEFLIFKLTVTDSYGLQDTDQISVNIGYSGNPPAADAGETQTVQEGNTVILDGSESYDPDSGDEIASYMWHQTDGISVTLSSSTAVKTSWVTPSVDANGAVLIFELTVTDTTGLQDTDEVRITVNDNGITGFPDDVITFESVTHKNMGIKSNIGSITRLVPVDPASISNNKNRPKDMMYGLIDLEIKVDHPGDAANIKIYLPSPVPQGYKWYKYNSSCGWCDFSNNAAFNAERNQITLILTDGGSGDDDGTLNGIITDPSGIGNPSTSETPDDTDDDTDKDSETSTSCFITTAESD